jgi:hypothetical protein
VLTLVVVEALLVVVPIQVAVVGLVTAAVMALPLTQELLQRQTLVQVVADLVLIMMETGQAVTEQAVFALLDIWPKQAASCPINKWPAVQD